MRSSVLDLGSNSFHVLVADVHEAGYVDPVLREREMLHLGRVVADHGHIPPEHVERVLAQVEHLSELARRAGAANRLAVATSALRDATNGPEVVARIAEVAGHPVRVLPGHEEARLSYLGVRAATGVAPGGLGVLDLGGGSLELAVGTRRTPDLVTSSNLGVSRLSALVAEDPISHDDRARLRAAIAEELELSGGAFDTHLPPRVVAVGGTVRAMARVVARNDQTWTPMTLNRFPLTLDRLRDLRDDLCHLDLDGRADVKGMKTRRADHLHIATIILVEVLQHLGVDRLEVCDWGLREGVLLDAAGTRTAPSVRELKDREVRRLHDEFTPDDDHDPHVADLAVQLFDVTRELHGLGDDQRQVLHQASMVHDIGQSLALRRHHKHGAYIIENAELRGFSPAECAQLVALVRFHSSRGLKDKHEAVRTMDDDRREATHVLLALLQAADGLDRTRDQTVTGMRLGTVDEQMVELHLEGEGLQIARAELARRTEVFSRVFDRDLVVRTPADEPAPA